MAARINIAGGTLKVLYEDGTEEDDVPYPSADVRLSTGPSMNRPAPRNSGVQEDLEVPGTHSDVCHYPSFVGAVSLLPLAITPSLLPSFIPSILPSFPPSLLYSFIHSLLPSFAPSLVSSFAPVHFDSDSPLS